MDGQIKSRMKTNKNLKITETPFEIFGADMRGGRHNTVNSGREDLLVS